MPNQWENFEKMKNKPGFLLIWGPESARKLGLWVPYSTHIKSACNEHVRQSILMWNQWEPFVEVTKHNMFYLLWGPKWPGNWTFEAQIVHLWKHLQKAFKARLMSFQRKLLTKYWKTWILTHLEAQNGPKIWASGAYLLNTCKNSSNELANEVSSQTRCKFLNVGKHGIYSTESHLAYHVKMLTSNQLDAIHPKKCARAHSLLNFCHD